MSDPNLRSLWEPTKLTNYLCFQGPGLESTTKMYLEAHSIPHPSLFVLDFDFALIFPFLHHQAQAYFGVGRSHHLEYRAMEYMLTTIWLSLAFSYNIITQYHR